jgi:hypothetical protein
MPTDDFEWTGARIEAAQLLAEGRLAEAAIAERVGCDRKTLWRWRQDPAFAGRVAEIVGQLGAEALRRGLAVRTQRLAAINDRWAASTRSRPPRRPASGSSGNVERSSRRPRLLRHGEAAPMTCDQTAKLYPAQRPYEPFGAARQLWTDRRPEVLLSGPAGTGKSRACLEKLHAACLRWPGARCLIVRKTRESLTETALVTFEEKVLPAGSPIAAGRPAPHPAVLHYPNGSTIVVGGLDKPGKVMSTEYDLVYVQEAIELHENDWESLTTRLRNGVVPSSSSSPTRTRTAPGTG